MNSLMLLNAGVSDELRYFQIDTQNLLQNLLQEIGGISTGIPPDFDRYKEMAWGLLEMGVMYFGVGKGRRIDEQRYNQALVNKFTLAADRDDIITDIAAALHTQLISVLDKTGLEYPFAYQMLANGDILIGIDVRDFIPTPTDDFGPNEEWVDYEQIT